MLTLIAVGIIIAAAVWSSIISKNDPLEAVANELNAHGYSMRGDELYILGGKADSTIREVLSGSEDAAEAELMVSAAKQAGFAAELDFETAAKLRDELFSLTGENAGVAKPAPGTIGSARRSKGRGRKSPKRK